MSPNGPPLYGMGVTAITTMRPCSAALNNERRFA